MGLIETFSRARFVTKQFEQLNAHRSFEFYLLKFCNMSTSTAPFNLHRIPEELVYHAQSASKSQVKRDKFGHCCLTDDNEVPVRGITWLPSKDTEAKGISTFAPFEDDDGEALAAAHALFDEKGEVLMCAILPKEQEIDNMIFVHDRDIPGQKSVAHHVLITPSSCVPRERFTQIGLCHFPLGAWVPCPIMLKGGAHCELRLPEPPDDSLLSLACNALEDFALDISKPGNARRAARFAQFPISKMDEWKELQGHPLLNSIIAEALLRWEEMRFDGFPIATRGLLRGMISDLSAWKEQYMDTPSIAEPTPLSSLPAQPMTYAQVWLTVCNCDDFACIF